MFLQFLLLALSLPLMSMEAPGRLTKKKSPLSQSEPLLLHPEVVTTPTTPKIFTKIKSRLISSSHSMSENVNEENMSYFKRNSPGAELTRTRSFAHIPQNIPAKKLTKLPKKKVKQSTSDDQIKYLTPNAEDLQNALAEGESSSKNISPNTLIIPDVQDVWKTKDTITRYCHADKTLYIVRMGEKTLIYQKKTPLYGPITFHLIQGASADPIEEAYRRLSDEFKKPE